MYPYEIVDSHVMQPEEVSVLRNHLARKLYSGLLTAPDTKENAKQLGIGKGCGSSLQQPLPRP